METKEQVYVFPYTYKPDLVNVDADKILLCIKKENKTLENYIHQYKFAGNYLDRREAIDYCAQKQEDPKALEILKLALKDPYHGIRNYDLGKLNMKSATVRQAVEPILVEMAKKDAKPTVKAKALELLSSYDKAEYKPLFEAALKDSSYSVAGAGLEALAAIDPAAGFATAKKMGTEKIGGKLSESVSNVLIESGSEEDFEFIAGNFEKLPLSQAKLESLQPFGEYLAKINNTEKLKKGVDMIVSFRDKIPAAYQSQLTPYINMVILKGIADKKNAAGAGNAATKEQVDYINKQISGKKGF